ncbi:response regulator [Actimicrobium antarcticum]|uniref:Response regulatory domain-containing protein n=1 Tax=Actimicrobium antarcticum TaxID=1051899 RepID=A0ABP7T0J5_9BURK
MLRVVIIDDNAVTRNLLTTMLVAGGHEVVGDSNTSDAGLARAIKLRPQLLCIDIGTDPVRSMEILDLLRASLPKVLIFIVSANMDPEIVQGALQRGVHGFIVKPFKSTTVTAIIRNAILKLARAQTRTVANQTAEDPISVDQPLLADAALRPEDSAVGPSDT